MCDSLFPTTILGFETLVGQNTAVKLHRQQDFAAMDHRFGVSGHTTFFMSNPLGPLTTRELLDRTVRIYGQHIFLFIGISALPYLCWVVINFCLLAGFPSFANLLTNALIDGGMWVRRHFPFIPPGVVTKAIVALAFICPALYGIAPLLLKLMTGAIVTAATSIGISDIYVGRKSTVIGCLSRLKGRVRKVLYASVALCVATGAGLILLIIPGIYWACRDGLAVPAVVLENIKGRQARARSAALTKGFVGRVLLIYLLFALLEYAMRLALYWTSYFIYRIAGKFAWILQPDTWVWMAAGLTITTPLISIALTLVYYDQRVRLEAFDLETMMSGAEQDSSVRKAMGVTS